jgi:RNA polymerase sigma-70 factor (ECF subfamily)
MPNNNLDSLITGCQSGDLSAFTELFHRCEGRAYRLAVTILRNTGDAEDVIQDVFLRIFRQIGGYRGDANFQTWLTAIIVNACRDRLRRQKIRRTIPLEWLRGNAIRDDTNPADEAEKRWELQTLWGIVNRMEDKYRLPMILFYHEGLTADEVGQVLKLPTHTVYTRLNAARQKLRTAIDEKQSRVKPISEKEIC